MCIRDRHTQCVTALFMLSPNTDYQYSVEWSDGTTTSGSFRTAATCRNTPVCLDKPDEPEVCPVENDEPNIVTGETAAAPIDFNNCTSTVSGLLTSGCYPPCVDVCAVAPEECQHQADVCDPPYEGGPGCTDEEAARHAQENAGDCMLACTYTVAYLDEETKRPGQNVLLDGEELTQMLELLERVGTPEAYPATVLDAYIDDRYCDLDLIAGYMGPPCTDFRTFDDVDYWQCKAETE